MLDKEKHQLILGRILRDIYADASIAPLLGLKGGTCAYLFYNLPRFSVDLDFDLLAEGEDPRQTVFEKIDRIIEPYGAIKDRHIKRNTIFFLLSYGDADQNIKIEINTRKPFANAKEHFELKEHLGISMLVGKKSYLFAGKLAALTSRGATAMRDVYDLWFFANNSWDIDETAIKIIMGKSAREQLADCVKVIEKIKDNEILRGLGELISEKEKAWVKVKLKSETIFLLKNYALAIKSS